MNLITSDNSSSNAVGAIFGSIIQAQGTMQKYLMKPAERASLFENLYGFRNKISD
jgi:hypothetical protein